MMLRNDDQTEFLSNVDIDPRKRNRGPQEGGKGRGKKNNKKSQKPQVLEDEIPWEATQ